MNIRMPLGALLLSATLAGCCPGSMLGSMPAPMPARPAPKPAVVATKPADADGDGVPDAVDRCPNTPKGVAVDAYGCPKDTDGDGVPDYLDKCPDTPHGVAVDANGCPKDTDGDGVPDYLDKCPDTPHGQSVNADGCSTAQLAPPPSRAETQLMTEGQIRLENVYFETNSAKLTAESSAPLDEAGAALAKYPQLKVEVEGHTDARGSKVRNLRLSQARANTVVAYLNGHFQLASGQLTAKGYGSSKPETAGKTPEDLQKERRVVLRVLNPNALKNVKVEH